jgi:hypothetical protein
MAALGLRVEPGRDLIHHARARLGAAFDRLEDDDVVRLHERFGVDYWVVPEAHPTSFPEAARVSGFKIVEVR